MHLLLDTHVLLWAAGQPGKLPKAALELLEAPQNELLFSAASLWEISIKRGLDRPDFRVEPEVLRRGLVDNGYAEVPITSTHAMGVRYLPDLHRDPFDRMLVVQAESEGALLLTVDDRVGQYPGPIRRI